MSDSATRLLCPWHFPGKDTGGGCHFLLQGIFPTQGSNTALLYLLHWQADSLPLSRLGSLWYFDVAAQLAKTGSIMDSWGEICAQAFKPVLIPQPETAKLKCSLQCLACPGAPQKHNRRVRGKTEQRRVITQSPGFWMALLSETFNY